MKPKIALEATHTVIALLGPTAIGKTALSLRLAKRFHGVIISADSRQVYRGLDLGTGKITQRERGSIPHYLLDVASPNGQYSVARYVRDVKKIIQAIPPSTPIFLVGGSPFYLQAITRPGMMAPVPPNPALRKKLAKKSTTALFQQLEKLDPRRAAAIDQYNPHRLIRAIEIAKGTPRALPTLPPLRILQLGLRMSNDKLFKRIDQRIDQRLRQGMIREVQRLHEQGLSWKRLDAFGLEYRWLSRYLQGQISKPEALQQLKSAIHDFARRQMTWWKYDQDILWITTESQALKLIKAHLTLENPRQP